ncbi:hypothetical protein [Marinobacter sp.]|uniref:hypothetical protein n=1 Tax=Marinobacter sp. TaxID=50741 RepID=UPI00384BB603
MSTKITEEHFKQEVEDLMARIDASREKRDSVDKSTVVRNISSFYYLDYPSLESNAVPSVSGLSVVAECQDK